MQMQMRMRMRMVMEMLTGFFNGIANAIGLNSNPQNQANEEEEQEEEEEEDDDEDEEEEEEDLFQHLPQDIKRKFKKGVRLIARSCAVRLLVSYLILSELYDTGNYLPESGFLSLRCKKLCIRFGGTCAYASLAKNYEKGYGVTKNPILAFFYFLLSAEVDNTKGYGCRKVGKAYLKGAGVARDLRLAKLYFLRAKEAGDVKAEDCLRELEK